VSILKGIGFWTLGALSLVLWPFNKNLTALLVISLVTIGSYLIGSSVEEDRTSDETGEE